MENAGRGCAEVLAREIESDQAQILICCGPGNNGGDGFVIARQLLNQGMSSRVLVTKSISDYKGDALTNLKILQQLPISLLSLDVVSGHQRILKEFESLTPTDWIVDALLGTGATGPLRPPFLEMVEWANQSAAKKLAVDIPTGLDCDSGLVNPTAIRADLTCTFIAPKIGFQNETALGFLGRLEVVGIGVPPEQILGLTKR